MSDFLLNLDLQIFYFFNTTISNPLMDSVFSFITRQEHWTLLYIYIIIYLLWKEKRRGITAAIILTIVIIISDQVNSSLIKSYFDRLRPCNDNLIPVRLLVECGGGKSFMSSHAVNNFAAAYVLSYFFKNYRHILFIVASMVAFSRVYVGVHYPSDIICGAAFGLFIGFSVIQIIKTIYPKVVS